MLRSLPALCEAETLMSKRMSAAPAGLQMRRRGVKPLVTVVELMGLEPTTPCLQILQQPTRWTPAADSAVTDLALAGGEPA
jgi:hypothetical protein